MPTAWKSGRRPSVFGARMRKKKLAMAREAPPAVARAVGVVEKELRARVFPARRVNKQDSATGKAQVSGSRNPISKRVESRGTAWTGTISLVSHWTSARTKAVLAVMASIGKRDQLFRKGLIVKNSQGKRILFASAPRLGRWAFRQDRGFQFERHVVYLKEKEALRRLQRAPAVNKSTDRIRQIWQIATQRGFRA